MFKFKHFTCHLLCFNFPLSINVSGISLYQNLNYVTHSDKSLGEFRAIARSAAGNKWYSTELSEVKNPCYSWLFN